MSNLTQFQRTLYQYLCSGVQCIAIQSPEEERVMDDIKAVVALMGITERRVVHWSATKGVRQVLPPQPAPISDSGNLIDACNQRPEKSVYVLTDTHTWPIGDNPIMNRALRDLIEAAEIAEYTVILLGPRVTIPDTCEKLVTHIEHPFPTETEFMSLIPRAVDNYAKQFSVKIPDYDTAAVARALAGMTVSEATNVLNLSLTVHDALNLGMIYNGKVNAVHRSGMLEVLKPVSIDEVGGLDALKVWLKKRAKAFTPEARAFNLPVPKGILIVSPPGCGKSLISKALGAILQVPVIRLDMGSVFGMYVGESEDKIRRVLKQAEAIAPCILIIDEVEKGLAGAGGQSGDGGATKRVFGTLLTWMQEKTAAVFVVATANDVTSIPPEFLRKGRFDELWSADLPTTSERRDILAIHIKKRQRDPSKFDLDTLAAATNLFVGAELEAVVNEALYDAFDDSRDISTEDMLRAVKHTTPLAKTAKDVIENMRAWATGRARRASTAVDSAAPDVTERKLVSMRTLPGDKQ